ncbi:MAG: 50S ribosomal protein L22 [Firmicutes bacterium]|nr:50S ribosomal protein L22 [Bacillota bacterium]
MQNVAVAKHNHLRISSRKVKIVIDLIRNKPVAMALGILRSTPKAASEPVEKLLLSAVANAENNHNMNVDALYVAEIFANQGPTMKRIRPRAQGRAFRILKRTSHITIVLKEKETPEAPLTKGKDKKAAKAADKKSTKAQTKATKAVDAEVAPEKAEKQQEKKSTQKAAAKTKEPKKETAPAKKAKSPKAEEKAKVNDAENTKADEPAEK